MRRTVYVGSLLAVGVLLDELAYWALTRHVIDRGIRWLDGRTRS
jgi:hypothetical protein